MEKIKEKRQVLLEAISALEASIVNFKNISEKGMTTKLDYLDEEDLYRMSRDSVIKRFEFTIDLFWKYLKKYLEDVVLVESENGGPKNVIRTVCKLGLISEQDAEEMFEMILCRNQTSHIYKEEIADKISNMIPVYCKKIITCVEKLKP